MAHKRQSEAIWNEARGLWTVKVQRDGIRKQFSSAVPGRKGKRIAEGKADDWLDNSCPETARFSAVWADYVASKELTVGTSSIRQIQNFGKHYLLPRLGNKIYSRISDQDWQDCIDAACRAGLARKSLELLRALILNLSRFARKKRLIVFLPEDLTIPRSAAAPKEHTILSPEDIQKLFSSSVENEYLNGFRLALLTGMRPGEWIGLRWDDLDGSTLHIRRAKNAFGEITTGKNDNAVRDIILSERARAALDAQRRQLKSAGILSPWVFPDVKQAAVAYQWKRFCLRYGLTPCTLYELRHTMISYMKSDVPEHLLKRAIGHSESMDTFGVYGHTVTGDSERTCAAINSVFDQLLLTR